MNRILISACAALAATASLTACSNGGATTAEEVASAKATTSAAASSSATADAASAAGGEPSSIKNDPVARRDVTMSKCSGGESGWAAVGTVANNQKKDANYTIVVSFTNKKATVLAREVAEVKVPAGKTADWKVDANFKAPSDVVCVLRGVDRA